MIYHFLNLVCWRDWQKFTDCDDIISLDSRSIVLLGRILGFKNARVLSGVEKFESLKTGVRADNYYLLAVNRPEIDQSRQFTLPLFKDLKSVDISSEIMLFLEKVPIKAQLLIGIASPKQNLLAKQIKEIRPDLDIYCLGAAIYFQSKETREQDGYMIKFFNSHLWIQFLRDNPRRTLLKILVTVIEIIFIIFITEHRNAFKQFMERANET